MIAEYKWMVWLPASIEEACGRKKNEIFYLEATVQRANFAALGLGVFYYPGGVPHTYQHSKQQTQRTGPKYADPGG